MTTKLISFTKDKAVLIALNRFIITNLAKKQGRVIKALQNIAKITKENIAMNSNTMIITINHCSENYLFFIRCYAFGYIDFVVFIAYTSRKIDF